MLAVINLLQRKPKWLFILNIVFPFMNFLKKETAATCIFYFSGHNHNSCYSVLATTSEIWSASFKFPETNALPFHINVNKSKVVLFCRRLGVLAVSALVSGSSGPGWSPIRESTIKQWVILNLTLRLEFKVLNCAHYIRNVNN